MPMIDSDVSQFLAALNFAARQHRTQRRKDGETAYINHPIEVTQILWEHGTREIDTLLAALLHDTVEDTAASPEVIAQTFGERVRDLVMEVTDDKRLPKSERKQKQIEHAPHLSKGARQIKLADKISNIRSIVELPPTDWSDERKRDYLAWAQNVVNALRGQNETLEQTFDDILQIACQTLDRE